MNIISNLSGKHQPNKYATDDERCHAEGELYQRGRVRHATLANDARAVQATALRVLTEFEAFARLDRANAKESSPAPR